MKKSIQSSLLLLLVSIIWGFAFVAQRTGTEFVGPFFFNFCRMFLATIVLIIPVIISHKKNGKAYSIAQSISNSDYHDNNDNVVAKDQKLYSSQRTIASIITENKLLIKGGILCGIVVYFASNTQQIALEFTSASKAGFITALYIVIVPILGIFLKHKTHWNTWVSVIIAVVALYFLSINESMNIVFADVVLIVSAFFWACHIICLDYFAPKVDVLKLSLIQFIVIAILSIISSLFFDRYFIDGISVEGIISVLPALLWVGVLSSGLAFTLQAIGQKNVKPSTAALILSLESVFSLVGGFLLLGERFTARESLGAILLFSAVILSQIPLKSKESH